MAHDDPTPDIYAIMDRAGLNGATIFATRKPIAQIINTIRTEMARELKAYIEERERPAPKTIEIKEQDNE